MTQTSRARQGERVPAALWSAPWWLRVGSIVTFVVMLLFSSLTPEMLWHAWPVWPVVAASMVILFGGLQQVDKLGVAGRIVWVSALFVMVAWLGWWWPSYLWAAIPLWVLAAAVLPLRAALLLTAATLVLVVTVLFTNT